MIEFEADDALAAAAERAAADPRVTRVVICTPDKDLSQSVRGTRVVQLNRRTREFRDEAGVIAKFGVPPSAIPDYLALVGDSSDGYPGLPGWGPKSAAAGTGALRSPGGHPGRLARVACQRREPRRAGRHTSCASAIARCSSERWRRCGPMRRCSIAWTTLPGTGRGPASRPSPQSSRRLVGRPVLRRGRRDADRRGREGFTRYTNVKTLYRFA